MNKLIIYHGSINEIKNPIYGVGKQYNDYGLGFYCTEYIELAKEWACSDMVDGYANSYEIVLDDLKVLNLSSGDYNILHWLAILVYNRAVRLSTPIAKKGQKYLIDNFLPNYEDYDIIIGYRADDSYFSFVRSFLSNEISLNQLRLAMQLGRLGEQIVLKSEKAFKQIKFIESYISDSKIYFNKRKNREKEAQDAYEKELEIEDLEGIFMRDIINEEMKPNDPRLS